MRFRSLLVLCFVLLLVSACSGQSSLPTAAALQTPFSATTAPLPTNIPRPTTTLRLTPMTTDTPIPLTATLDLPQSQLATERGATAQAQTLFASLPRTATVIVQLNQATHPAIVIPEAWVAVRAVLPSDILVYMPTYIPVRFRSPEVYEVEVSHALFSGPVYTIGYGATTDKGDADTVVFILNNGLGSWGSVWAGPTITKKSITVDGASGELWMVPEQHPDPSRKTRTFYWASWKKQGQGYQVKAISSRMTEAEFMQIVHSLVLIKR